VSFTLFLVLLSYIFIFFLFFFLLFNVYSFFFFISCVFLFSKFYSVGASVAIHSEEDHFNTESNHELADFDFE